MAVVPHERSLVTRMQNKPFVLLGVNLDETRERLKVVEKNHQITWRSWFDGRLKGPIFKQYCVSGLPAVYLIDAKGVIRYKDLEGKKLDEAVDGLVTEVTRAAK
jgi:hypothetical protein